MIYYTLIVIVSYVIQRCYFSYMGYTESKGIGRSFKLAQAITLDFYSGGAGSNLSRNIDYPYYGFWWFPSGPSGRCRCITLKRKRKIPSTLYPIHYIVSYNHSTLYSLRDVGSVVKRIKNKLQMRKKDDHYSLQLKIWTYLKIPAQPERNYKKPQDSKQPKAEPNTTQTQVQRLPVHIPALRHRTP
jgi:hypothetical protein